jgi:hypothetical protein
MLLEKVLSLLPKINLLCNLNMPCLPGCCCLALLMRPHVLVPCDEEEQQLSIVISIRQGEAERRETEAD